MLIIAQYNLTTDEVSHFSRV